MRKVSGGETFPKSSQSMPAPRPLGGASSSGCHLVDNRRTDFLGRPKWVLGGRDVTREGHVNANVLLAGSSMAFRDVFVGDGGVHRGR